MKHIIFCSVLMVGCSAEQPTSLANANADPRDKRSSPDMSTQALASVKLVSFVDRLVPVPDRENSGKLILSEGCVVLELEFSGSQYTPIFENGAAVTQKGQEITGVIVSEQFISLNSYFRFGGAIVRDLKLIPAISSIPEECPHEFHSIGGIKL